MKKILPGERKAQSPNISIGGTLTSDKSLITDSFNKMMMMMKPLFKCHKGILVDDGTYCGH